MGLALMIHARSDYNLTIQQCDKAALRTLFEDMIQAIGSSAGASITRAQDALSASDCFRARFEIAMHETIPANEPVFLLRAQDQVAADAVRAYAHLHSINGGSDRVYTAAMRHADLMQAWPKKKAADAPQEALEATK